MLLELITNKEAIELFNFINKNRLNEYYDKVYIQYCVDVSIFEKL